MDDSVGQQDERHLTAPVPGVEIQLLNSVAPYDYVSEADTFLMSRKLSTMPEALMNRCLREEEGVTQEVAPPPELPDRSQVMGFAVSTFPDIERISHEGLPNQDVPIDGGDIVPETPNLQGAQQRCFEKYEDSMRSLLEIDEQWRGIRSAWEDVRNEIESLEEVRGLRAEFTACLRDSGVAPDDAVDETAFLFSVDRAIIAADGDEARIRGIRMTQGQLYANCARDLFEARERLAGGRRRAEFLAENAAALQELQEAIHAAEQLIQ